MKEQNTIRSQLDKAAERKGKQMLEKTQGKTSGKPTAHKLTEDDLETEMRATLRKEEAAKDHQSDSAKKGDEGKLGPLEKLGKQAHLETYLRHQLDSSSEQQKRKLYDKSVKNSLLRGVEKLVSQRRGGGASTTSAIHKAEMRLFKASMQGAKQMQRRASVDTSGKLSSGKLFASERSLLDQALKLDGSKGVTSSHHGQNGHVASLPVHGIVKVESTVLQNALKHAPAHAKPFADVRKTYQDDEIHDMAHAEHRADALMHMQAKHGLGNSVKRQKWGENNEPSFLSTLGHSKALQSARQFDRTLEQERSRTVKEATKDEEEAVE